jgi:hypothetical protein
MNVQKRSVQLKKKKYVYFFDVKNKSILKKGRNAKRTKKLNINQI